MWPKVSFLVSSPTFCFFFRGEKSFQQATSKEYNLALLSITIILFFNRRKVASNSEEFWTLHENGNGKGCRAIQNTTDKEFQKLLKELFNNPEDIKKPLSAPWNLERKKKHKKKKSHRILWLVKQNIRREQIETEQSIWRRRRKNYAR